MQGLILNYFMINLLCRLDSHCEVSVATVSCPRAKVRRKKFASESLSLHRKPETPLAKVKVMFEASLRTSPV